MYTVSNRNTRNMWNMFKVVKKTPERSRCRRSGVSIVNFEHISHLSFSASIVDSKQVNVRWVMYYLSPPVVNSKHTDIEWMGNLFIIHSVTILTIPWRILG